MNGASTCQQGFHLSEETPLNTLYHSALVRFIDSPLSLHPFSESLSLSGFSWHHVLCGLKGPLSGLLGGCEGLVLFALLGLTALGGIGRGLVRASGEDVGGVCERDR